MTIRILFFSDTHLGFDFPVRPRVERRRRGDDFFDAFQRVLDSAREREVDVVVHGGDLFFRSRVHASIVHRAYERLLEVAHGGIPVVVVPGNHERSNLPPSLFRLHHNLFIFESPSCFSIDIRGARIRFAGFPYVRDVRNSIGLVLDSVRNSPNFAAHADFSVLCMHQIVEMARVPGYVFRSGTEVIRADSVPSDFDLILSGHIHTGQFVETRDGKTAGVYFAGSTERTSYTERNEDKGYFIFDVTLAENQIDAAVHADFIQLPVRPMFRVDLVATGKPPVEVYDEIARSIAALPEDAIVQFRVEGPPVRDSVVRSIAPSTMNVEVVPRYPRNR